MSHIKCSKRMLASCIALASINVLSQENENQPVQEEVVVTGMRASLENALNVKQTSQHVVEALDLNDIDSTPDVTIAEAIVRLPGVNGARDRGNQSQAAIRGLGPRMVFGTVNGREVASSEPGRSIRFEQYPAELISMVRVYKTQSADLISGGIAGTVDLDTVSPLDYNGPQLSLRAGLVSYDGGDDIPDYDTLGNRMSASFVKQVSDDFGFALGFTSQEQKNAYPSYQAWGFNTGAGQENLPAGGGDLTGSGDFAYVPWGIQSEIKKLTTDRRAMMGVLQFSPSDAVDIKYDALYSEFDMDEQQNQTWYMDIGNWDNGEAGGYSDVSIVDNRALAATANQWTGNVRHVIAAYDQKNSVLSHGLNIDVSGIESWLIEADLSWSKAERDNYWNALYLDSFGNPFSYDLRGTPSVTVPEDSPSANPETASLGIGDWNEGSDLVDEITALQLDFSKSLDGTLASIDFGARIADREKDVIWEGYAWSWNEGLGWVWGDNEVPAAFSEGVVSSYTVGEIETSPFLNARSYDAVVADLTGGQTNFSEYAAINPDSSWKVTEDSLGAYLKLNFEGQLGGVDYSANAGVRYESFDMESFAIDDQGVAGDSVVNEVSEILPSATLNLFLDENRILRFGLSKAISRPPLDELRAGQYISAVSGAVGGNTGNPNLEPFTSNQIDASYEWYFAKESLLAVAVYHKDIDNYVGYTSFDIPAEDQTITVWAPTNGEGGTIQGLELTFQKPLGKHFGVYSNYAYADSDITEFAPEEEPYEMAGLAEHTATLDFWFSSEKLEARLGWKYHSGYTTGFEWDGSALRRLDSEKNLGLSLTYHWNDNLSFRFQGNNLTDQPLRLTQNNDERDVRRYDVYGKTFLFDVSWKM